MARRSYFEIGFDAGCLSGPDTPERNGIPDDASARARNQFFKGYNEGVALRRAAENRRLGITFGAR